MKLKGLCPTSQTGLHHEEEDDDEEEKEEGAFCPLTSVCMEDVVLHYQPGSGDGLGSLLETTEKLLELFPCRTPPVFTSWFPADRRLPIRPAKPAPVITSSGASLVSFSKPAAATEPRPGHSSENREANGVAAETQNPKHGVSESPDQISRPSAEKQTDSPVRRSWSVFEQREVLPQSSESMSKRFRHMVSVHKLQLRQRAKWVIREHNCGAARDIEQVWRTLIRSVRGSGLPPCNANIQRQRAEIWVFCDVLHGERVGRHLKDELQLSGRISLSVHRLGDVFSM